MKKQFVEPEVTVVKLSAEDVICTSSCTEEDEIGYSAFGF